MGRVLRNSNVDKGVAVRRQIGRAARRLQKITKHLICRRKYFIGYVLISYCAARCILL
jgi:hypothetical protein